MPMRLPALLLAVAIALAAGCGGGEEGATEGGGGETAGQTIEVSATDFDFNPNEITADPGEITFALTNDGDSPHALEVEGNGVEEESETIDPGESTELTVNLEEGQYEIYCPVDGHKDAGMTGTLTVGAPSGGAGTGTGDTETGETTTGETETGETETEESDDNSGSGSGY